MLANFVEAALSQAVQKVDDFKMKHFNVYQPEEESNGSIVINQIAGQQNMVLMSTGTYADPDPIQTANTENFYVEGIWNIDGSVMTDVYFYCNLQGVTVFEQTFPCSAGDANCPTPTGTIGELWNGVFGFDVPGFAPPFEYDVHVVGKDASGNELWELESKFYI